MRRVVFVFSLMGAIGLTGTVSANSVGQSLRPLARPLAELVPVAAAASTVVRPQLRPAGQAAKRLDAPVQTATNPGFESWVRGFRGRALAKGISASTFDRAFRGVEFDAGVIERDRNQSEFTRTIWQYLDSAVSEKRVRNGKNALRQHQRTLDAIEARYGVEKEVVLAVWGLESSYGDFRGDLDVIQSLATLAFDGRRGKFFEAQLIGALQILQSGDVAPRNMTGSWAGAMGHTQFIPTSYLAFAVDFTGDGKRDIWSEDPTDALASTAAYLQRSGWKNGQPWGVEVNLPGNFNFGLANRKTLKSPAEWANLGVVGLNGSAVPNHGAASILLPAGGNGAAFMIFSNFRAIERYNAADAYVIGVGHLSDRINGGPAINARWPEGERGLTEREKKEVQRRLTRAGFDTQGIDGKFGPNTINAVRAYQRSIGAKADGYPGAKLLKQLRGR